MPKYEVGESDSEASLKYRSRRHNEAEPLENEPLAACYLLGTAGKITNMLVLKTYTSTPRGNSQLHYSEQETEARDKEACLSHKARLLGDW